MCAAIKIKIIQVGKEHKEHGRPYIDGREGRFGKAIKGDKVKTGDDVVVK